MIDFSSPEFFSYAIFGVILNFIFSMAFGVYLSNNIGIEEMMLTKGAKEQPWWLTLSLAIPFAKMVITLYRVAILQFYFLNQGKSHKEFWIYLTSED
ncbi:MAG: hypothetical protein PHW18_06305 [Sulfuricurvum sp.]|uniref:hypothetical protein n=1 Tax=Sulfuricurvum sp. TaxID=2025608 RepID=UPI0026121D25|nr:hypothetical protein [Sulfuricurvum sp.]MDD2829168.1 hypothetical protein [Sulfuricurvum sp.]MDD4950217.1 hypothetical protein [Sulfuricurvum sp.]